MWPSHEAVNGILEFKNCENHEFRSESTDVEQLVVWGGWVANCGEHSLSQIVDTCADKLRRVVYCPVHTKGGCLVRPKYHERDRDGQQTFPQLTDLAIRLDPVLLPSTFGWITPKLRRLRLLCVVAALRPRGDGLGGQGVCDAQRRCVQDLRQWLNPGLRWRLSLPEQHGQHPQAIGPQAAPKEPVLLQQLHEDCPQLESVTVALCSTAFDASMDEVEWLQLLPPQPIPWSTSRLLLLPVLKPQSAPARAEDGGGGRSEGSGPKRYESPLSLLSVALLQLVFAFLCRQSWTCLDRGLGQEDAARLELPADFCQVTALDVLSPPDAPAPERSSASDARAPGPPTRAPSSTPEGGVA